VHNHSKRLRDLRPSASDRFLYRLCTTIESYGGTRRTGDDSRGRAVIGASGAAGVGGSVGVVPRVRAGVVPAVGRDQDVLVGRAGGCGVRVDRDGDRGRRCARGGRCGRGDRPRDTACGAGVDPRCRPGVVVVDDRRVVARRLRRGCARRRRLHAGRGDCRCRLLGVVVVETGAPLVCRRALAGGTAFDDGVCRVGVRDLPVVAGGPTDRLRDSHRAAGGVADGRHRRRHRGAELRVDPTVRRPRGGGDWLPRRVRSSGRCSTTFATRRG